MLIKVGDKKNIHAFCLKDGSPEKEQDIPSEFENILWSVDRSGYIDIKPNGREVTIVGIKSGVVNLSFTALKKSRIKADQSEFFSDSMDIEVQDDSKPKEVKSGVVSVHIKEK